MDTRIKWYKDPVYIKMWDCEEIQKLKPLDPYRTSSVWHDDAWGGFTWLPRQDQLQEMSEYFPSTLLLNSMFWNFAKDCYLPDEASMEQLWLAFVMKELHNKQWTGSEWSCIS